VFPPFDNPFEYTGRKKKRSKQSPFVEKSPFGDLFSDPFKVFSKSNKSRRW
jgi:hypothetical protein